jgi:hypothetical protein
VEGRLQEQISDRFSSSSCDELSWHGAFKNLPKDQRSPNLVYRNQNAEQLIPRKVKTYEIGDSVRVRLPRRMFEKRSLPEWSREIYTVRGAGKYTYDVRDPKGTTTTLGSKDLQPATESFSVRRSARGRAVDNLPGPAKVFSLSPLRKPFTKEIKQVRQSSRVKKKVDYSRFF